MSPTSVKFYQGAKVKPLADVYLVETEDSDPPVLNTCELTSIDLTGAVILTPQCKKLLALLKKYVDLFTTEDDPLGRTSVVRHTISADSPPICQPVCRQPMALQSTFGSPEDAATGSHPTQFLSVVIPSSNGKEEGWSLTILH